MAWCSWISKSIHGHRQKLLVVPAESGSISTVMSFVLPSRPRRIINSRAIRQPTGGKYAFSWTSSMHLEKIDDYRWLIPRTYKAGMLTDTVVYASELLLDSIRSDQSLEQAANIAMLPGIVGRALAM